MASGSSIVFTAFGSGSDPVLRGWIDFRSQLLAGTSRSSAALSSEVAQRPKPAEAAGRRMGAMSGSMQGVASRAPSTAIRSGIWRLIASNHREVARSLHLYETLAQARDHVRDLQESERQLTVRLVRGPASGQHGWVASVNDTAVMSCGRWYSASALCRESAQYALDALGSAQVATTSRATGSFAAVIPAVARAESEVKNSW